MCFIYNAEKNSNDDVKSKENPKVTRVSSKGIKDYSNNIASKEDLDTDFDTDKSFRRFKIVNDAAPVNRQLLHVHQCRAYYGLCRD